MFDDAILRRQGWDGEKVKIRSPTFGYTTSGDHVLNLSWAVKILRCPRRGLSLLLYLRVMGTFPFGSALDCISFGMDEEVRVQRV
jgi:hypothetical protein